MLKVLPGVGLTRGISTNSLVAHPSNDASCLRCHCGSSSSSDLHQLQLGIGPRTRGLVMPVSRGTSSLANHRDSRNPRPQLPAIPARSFPRHRRVIHPLPTDFIPDTCARGHPVLVPLRGTPGTRAHRAPPPPRLRSRARRAMRGPCVVRAWILAGGRGRALGPFSASTGCGG